MKDGGQAFPAKLVKGRCRGREFYSHYPGMTLLDYFAGQALVGFLSNPSLCDLSPDTWDKQAKQNVSRGLYDISEAMLAERERRMKLNQKEKR